MPIETKDIVGWVITGGIGCVSLFLNWQTRRDTRRKDAAEKDRLWSLNGPEKAAPGVDGLLMYLRLEDPDINRFRLLSIKIVRPRGCKIAAYESNWGADVVYSGRRPSQWTDILEVNKDLEPYYILANSAHVFQHSRYYFFVSVPEDTASRRLRTYFVKEASSRNSRASLLISIEVEEISSKRKVTRLTIASQPITWPISTTPSVT